MPAEGEKKSMEEFMDALEDFFCSPKFTTALGEFLSQHGDELEFVPPEETQPLKNHDIFMRYQDLVEQQLTSFLGERGLRAQEVFEACASAQAAGDAGFRTCVDYLLACTEYESFMQLAADHVHLREYEAEPGSLDDYELPPADDEDEGGRAVVPLDEGGEEEEELAAAAAGGNGSA
uniref:Cilia- and flagella-associated protein 36 n=1 Tax=Chlamydomonas leiostraca TaxID=1034604 RepID=A0A7S0WVR0_9CHLO|mmetsp:Transcript_31336/g.79934  ORF Transcript_31336/g.79934 Transcript_31336/m.79934 type:complete len:177 (+) Transcript_31336:96-626(+)